MPSFNLCIFMGHLTRDPEEKKFNDSVVANFGIAVNRRWKDSRGEDKEEVMFLDCAAWNRVGEFILDYFSKGDPIHVTGRLEQQHWEDKDTGDPRSKHAFVVQNATFTGSKDSDDDDEDEEPRSRRRSSGGAGTGRSSSKGSSRKKNNSSRKAPF